MSGWSWSSGISVDSAMMPWATGGLALLPAMVESCALPLESSQAMSIGHKQCLRFLQWGVQA
eukprot:5229706-Pyramimonas_sp.AAC.1